MRICAVWGILSVLAGWARGDDFREGLKLGTGPGKSDVASDGHTSSSWLANPDVVTPGGEYKTDFYAEVPQDDEQTHGVPTIFAADKDIAWVPASAGTLTGLPTRFRVFYHCRKPGTVSLEAKLPLKGYNDVVWKWSKQCTDDVPVHLSVGTEERGEDIVTEGKVEAAWNATSPTVKFPPTQTLVTTHITTTEDQAFYEPEFEVEPPIATAVVEGHFDAAVATVPESFPHDQPVSFLAKNQHAPFVVRVSCHEPGLATVSARVRPYALYDGFRPLLIGWKHQCGGVPRPNLAIATQVLHEGVEEEDADVARNGAILPTWTQLNYTADAQQLITIFHYALVGGSVTEATHDSQQLSGAKITVDPPIAKATLFNQHAQAVPSTLPPARGTKWTAFGLRLACNTTALQKARVTLTLQPGVFDPIRIEMVKLCGGFKSGASVAIDRRYVAGSDDGVSGQASVVRDGKALDQWAPGNKEATELAEPEEGLPFIVRLGSGAPQGSHHSTVLRSKSGKQGVGKPEVRFQDADDADWLQVKVRGSMKHGGVFKEGISHSLALEVTCPSWGFFPSILSSGFSGRTAPLTVSIPLVGFQPLVFSYQQQCDGWIQSPLGASLFATFLLLLVGGGYFLFSSLGLGQQLHKYSPIG